MLELIREKMRGIFAMIIVGFFCAVFALWGVEQLFQSGSHSQAVAVVNGEDITPPALANAIVALRGQYVKMLGEQVDASFLNDAMLRKPALESLISRKVLEAEVSKLGMTVGSKMIDQAIVGDANFSRDGKKFDPEYYKERLRSSGVTALGYQQSLRTQLSLSQLQDGVANTAFVTQNEIKDIARLEGQKRSFDYIRFPLKTYEAAIIVSDASIDQYYKDHKSEFMSEETVALEYVDLDKKILEKSIKLNEADVQAAYDKEAADFKPVLESKAAHILIDAKDGAQQEKLDSIEKRLHEGEDFALLAKEYSSDTASAKHGGDVGFTTGSVFVPEFEKALADLANVGDVSKPIKTEFGYHVIKLLERHKTVMKPFSERKNELEAALTRGKVDTLFNEKIALLAESTYGATDLKGPAQELDMAVHKSDVFTRRGGVGLFGQQKIIEAAFSEDILEKSRNSAVIELSSDRAVVLRLSEYTKSTVRDLSEVKPSIIEKLKHAEAVIQLQKKMAGLKTRAQKEDSLLAIAAEEKLKDVTATAKTRDASGEEANLVGDVFSMPRPQDKQAQVSAFALKNGDWALVRLTAVDDVKSLPGSPEYQAVAARLNQGVGATAFEIFEKQLRNNTKIVRHDESAPERKTEE